MGFLKEAWIYPNLGGKNRKVTSSMQIRVSKSFVLLCCHSLKLFEIACYSPDKVQIIKGFIVNHKTLNNKIRCRQHRG
eukprot:c34186_g1_i1 orf=313-546(+)